jgi:hypothetical protein
MILIYFVGMGAKLSFQLKSIVTSENELEWVQLVHTLADFLDITFCTCRF